jgi:hypothetical protein
MRAVEWLWPSRFAIGKLGLIGGLPDKGKGLICSSIIEDALTVYHATGLGAWAAGSAPRGGPGCLNRFSGREDLGEMAFSRFQRGAGG